MQEENKILENFTEQSSIAIDVNSILFMHQRVKITESSISGNRKKQPATVIKLLTRVLDSSKILVKTKVAKPNICETVVVGEATSIRGVLVSKTVDKYLSEK